MSGEKSEKSAQAYPQTKPGFCLGIHFFPQKVDNLLVVALKRRFKTTK